MFLTSCCCRWTDFYDSHELLLPLDRILKSGVSRDRKNGSERCLFKTGVSSSHTCFITEINQPASGLKKQVSQVCQDFESQHDSVYLNNRVIHFLFSIIISFRFLTHLRHLFSIIYYSLYKISIKRVKYSIKTGV